MIKAAIIILFILVFLIFCLIAYVVGIFQFQIDKIKRENDGKQESNSFTNQ